MPSHFLDTSALVKRYLPERGSRWIAGVVATSRIGISELAIAELASVLGRQCRERRISRDQRDTQFRQFLADLPGYEVVRASQQPLELASRLLLMYEGEPRIRTLDAIQVVSAQLWFGAMSSGADEKTFVVADKPLHTIATRIGLACRNPEDHE